MADSNVTNKLKEVFNGVKGITVQDDKIEMDGETIYYLNGKYEPNKPEHRKLVRRSTLAPIKKLIEYTEKQSKAFVFYCFDEIKKYIFSFEIVAEDFTQFELITDSDAINFDKNNNKDIIRMERRSKKADGNELKGYLVAIKIFDDDGNPYPAALRHYLLSSDNRTYNHVIRNMFRFIMVADQENKSPVNPTKLPHNLLVSGAPGTGKSHYLEKEVLRAGGIDIDSDDTAPGGVIKEAIDKDNSESDQETKTANAKKQYCAEYVTRVTFYEDYSYESFVGCYKPIPVEKSESEIKYAGQEGTITEDKITYKFVPGPFIDIYIKAKTNTGNYFLIIEEINRAKAASVFGDIFQLLDRDENGISEYAIKPDDALDKYLREKLGDNKYDGSLRLPGNLYIWATMNSADQGVMPLDSAFKRRWAQLYMDISPDSGKVRKDSLTMPVGDHGKRSILWEDLRVRINKVIIANGFDEDRCIGPWYFKEAEIAQINAYFDESSIENRGSMVNPLIDKLIYYLRQDVFRRIPSKMFNNETDGISMSDLRRRVRSDEAIDSILNIDKFTWEPEEESKTVTTPASEHSVPSGSTPAGEV